MSTKKAGQEDPKNEVEQLKFEIAQLKAKLEKEPKSLEDTINYLQEKQKQVKRLNYLRSHYDLLSEFIDKMKEATNDDALSIDEFGIDFWQKSGYQKKEFLTIQNPSVLMDSFVFISDVLHTYITKTELLISK